MLEEKSQPNELEHGGFLGEFHSQSESALKFNQGPVVALALVIMALLGALIGVIIHRNGSEPARNDEVIATLQSELGARRAELNRQRIALGLSPLDGGAEPVGAIAERFKKDADSLVMLATRYQEMLAEKDSEIAGISSKLLDSEKLRKDINDDNARLRRERDNAMDRSSDAESMRTDIAAIKSQRDAYAQELTLAKEKLKTMSSAASTDDYAELQRRLEEAVRAKDFFEARVKKLEEESPVPR